MGLSKKDIEHAESLALAAKAEPLDCEVWHMRSDELWLFVLQQIGKHSTDEKARLLAKIALVPRDDTSGWYA